MGTFTSILAGIGIGLATSITAWLLTLIFLAPRMRIREIGHRVGDGDPLSYKFLVASRRWRRDLNDVQINCALHIPHDETEENVLAIQASTGSFPFVPADWERVITISMDISSLSPFGVREVAKRLSELNPPQGLSDIASVADLFVLIPGTRVEVVVFASDPLSGARRASRASLTWASSELPSLPGPEQVQQKCAAAAPT